MNRVGDRHIVPARHRLPKPFTVDRAFAIARHIRAVRQQRHGTSVDGPNEQRRDAEDALFSQVNMTLLLLNAFESHQEVGY